MAISFLNLFKKKGASAPPIGTVPPPTPTVEKAGGRLSKTVVPSAARPAPAADSFKATARPAPANPPAAPAAPRSISFAGPTPPARPADLPPAVALALEPRIERVISLSLADVIHQMPVGWTRPVSEAEGEHRVLLKAAEIERGMANGRPAVSLTSIYHQVPEIFVRPVPESDSSQVALPFAKVLEQFASLQTRSDQAREQNVPQVETPFLRVTLEDNSRFGIKMDPPQTTEAPQVYVEPATAQAIADAEPEAIPQPKAQPSAKPVRLPVPPPPDARVVSIAAPPVEPPSVALPDPPAPLPEAPTRIPFKLSPTGPGVPASERVPASSGPSVPTGAQPPTRIPFKLPPATGEVEAPKAGEPWLTREAVEGAVSASGEQNKPTEPQAPETKISLALKPIMKGLPPFQLTGDINSVPEEARIELPFSWVERQLSSGRVVLKPDDFAAALPPEFASLFSSKEIATPVALPLQEVLKNLPAESLRMRDDQEEQEKGSQYETPFSSKAKEDERRFNIGTTPPAKASKAASAAVPTPEIKVLPTPVSTPEAVAPSIEPPLAPASVAPAPAAEIAAPVSTQPSASVASVPADEIDAKSVVAKAGELVGVKACAIMFTDGLSLAGCLPEEFAADGLCAMAPSLLQRIEDHMAGTKLGALCGLTISCEEAALTFFMHGKLCLAAIHSKEDLAADVRERLGSAVQELSKKYSHP